MQEGKLYRYKLDLGKERNDKPFADINFTSFYVEHLDGEAEIKLGSINNNPYDLNSLISMEGLKPTEQFYLTNEKQEGKTLQLVIVKGMKVRTSAMNSMSVIDTVGIKSSQVNFDDENNDLIVKPRNSKAESSVPITPSDTDVIDVTSGIYIGTMGDLRVRMKSGETVTYKSLANGVIHSIRCDKIFQSGTTAEDILALY